MPKGVPEEVGPRQLAVQVPDHALEYGSFAGTIPKGEYGAGTVEIWDEGTFDLKHNHRPEVLLERGSGWYTEPWFRFDVGVVERVEFMNAGPAWSVACLGARRPANGAKTNRPV